MAAALLDEEVPCRDTDPLPSKDLDSNRDSPVAFTINFGFGDEDPDSAKEKAKKLERFALRSSLRKPKSPRTVQSPASSETSQTCAKPGLNDSIRGKTMVREKSNLSFRSYRTKSANPSTATESNTANCHNQQQSVINTPSTTTNRELLGKSAHRKESSSSRHSSSQDYQMTSSSRDQYHHPMTSSSRDQHNQMTSSSRDQRHTPPLAVESRRNPPLAESRRRLTTTLSPEESKMISHFEKEIEAHSLEIVERSYEDEEFEVETESSPSETGTYTVGREEKERRKKESCEEIARFELENLVGDNQTRSNYVQDWASRHHAANTSRHAAAHHHTAANVERGASAPSLRPTLIPSPRSGGDCSPTSPPPAAAQMLGGTSSSLSKSRRRLPATPGGVASSTPASGVLSPDSTEFSPSTDSPSPTQESDEGETNFMKHTQHLVDVMEARINQKTGPSLSSRTIKSSTIIKKKATTSLSSGDTGVNLDPREAWERRKNYDPLIASGRKKEPVSGRKSSSASIGRSPREDTQLSTTNRYQERGSTKSASSDSSGYFSRGEGSRGGGLNRGDGGRYSMRGNPHKLKAITRPSGTGAGIKQPISKPQSKLMASDKQTSRSSSCLTSKEAEFQAWKRRKNYDPLKSANSAANSNTSATAGVRTGTNTSSIRSSANKNNTTATSKAESINNRFSGRGSNGTTAGRSDSTDGGNSPRNAYAPSPTPHQYNSNGHHQGAGASGLQHKRIQEMSQSLVHGRGAGPSFSMGATDHQPPMQRSASFHYENMRMRSSTGEDQLRMYSLQGTIHTQTSEEDESTEPDYGSGCDSSNADGGHRHYYLDEDELILPIYPSGYTGSNRSIYNRSLSPKPSPSRSRSRLEALDNLVISTIYSVSSKLCNNTQSILKRAGLTFPPTDEDQATTLETVLYLLEDVDLPSSPAKKTSRELSGTLRNLKKCEQALEVLHKLIESDQDD